MRVYHWVDRCQPAAPRATMQRGECGDGHCGQYSLSISNGSVGMTVRFDSEDEFRRFLEHGELAPRMDDADRTGGAVGDSGGMG